MTTVGLAFSYQFEATGALNLSVDESTLPPGLTFDSTLHAIVGNPTTADSYSQSHLSPGNLDGTRPRRSSTSWFNQRWLLARSLPASQVQPAGRGVLSPSQVLTNGGSSEA